MRILITGGTGFIGSNVAERLAQMGHQVIALGRYGENVPRDIVGFYTPADEAQDGDFARAPWHNMGTVDALVHMAAITDTTCTDHERLHRVNVVDALTLFRQAAAHGVRRIVYASSGSVYGAYGPGDAAGEEWLVDPLTPYAASKAELDECVRQMGYRIDQTAVDGSHFCRIGGAEMVGLRFSNVYGRGEEHKGPMRSVVLQCLERMLRGKSPRLFQWGQQARDWLYIEDAISAVLAALEANAKPGIYNVGSGVATSFNGVVVAINDALAGKDHPRQETTYIPVPETLKGKYQKWTCLDLRRVATDLCWGPLYPLEAGVRCHVKELTPTEEKAPP